MLSRSEFLVFGSSCFKVLIGGIFWLLNVDLLFVLVDIGGAEFLGSKFCENSGVF